METEEIWKESPEFPFAYEVSNKGRVRSVTQAVRANRERWKEDLRKGLSLSIRWNGKNEVRS